METLGSTNLYKYIWLESNIWKIHSNHFHLWNWNFSSFQDTGHCSHHFSAQDESWKPQTDAGNIPDLGDWIYGKVDDVFLYGKLFGLVEVVLFCLVDLYIVGWFFCSVFGLLFCWFAWWCLVYIVLIGLVLGGTLRCHKGDSLYEPDHRRSPMKNLIAAEVKIKPFAQSPCGIIQKVRKSRMSKSQTAPYFNSTGNALNPLIEWIEMMEVGSGKSRFSPW